MGGIENRRQQFFRFPQSIGIAGNHSQHGVGIGSLHSTQQVFLMCRQFQIGTVIALPCYLHGVVAQTENDHVRLFRQSRRTGDAVLHRHQPEQPVWCGLSVRNCTERAVRLQCDVHRTIMPAAKPHGISIRFRFEPFPNEPLIGRIADCLIGAVFGDVLAVAAGTEIHTAKIPVVKQKGFPFADLFCCRTERTVRRNGAVLSGFHRLKGDHRITVIKQHIFCPQLLPQSLQNRYGIGRNAGVPVPIVLVSQRPDHSDPGIRLQLQRQDPAVMEQAHLFHGSTAVHCTVQQRVRFRRLGVIGTAVPVKFSQPEPSGERIPHSTVNIGFCQQPSVQCISGCCRHHVCFIGHHIIAVFQAGGKSLCMGGVRMVCQHILGKICSVCHNEFQPPLFFYQRFQVGIHAGGNAV